MIFVLKITSFTLSLLLSIIFVLLKFVDTVDSFSCSTSGLIDFLIGGIVVFGELSPLRWTETVEKARYGTLIVRRANISFSR